MNTRHYAIPVTVALLALLMTTLPALAATGDTLNNARDATAVFNDPTAALAGGYDLLTDAAGLACIEQPGAGGMGVHYVKGSLVQSGTIDAARPQALVYEIQPTGRPRLVALEYVVFQAAWDAAHNAPPSLFGETFMLNPAGNRFGLPAFYALHAWIGKHNPSGTFGPFNPTVHCDAARADNADDQSTATTASATAAQMPFVCSMPPDMRQEESAPTDTPITN